jgi:hypothetical protein
LRSWWCRVVLLSGSSEPEAQRVSVPPGDL